MCLPTIGIIGSPATALEFDAQIGAMLDWAAERSSKSVCIANVHMLVEAHRHSAFANVLQDADIVAPDGMPLVWMMRWLGFSNQNRVAGLDVLHALCQSAPSKKVSVFFLGSHQMILDRIRQRLEIDFPQLDIAGMCPLPFRPLTPEEDSDVINLINQSGAGIVFVSLGCPKQEYWMAEHKDKVNAVMIGLGGAFPVYAGIHRRAPLWMRNFGLEWLYRLLQEPRRLLGRYSATIPPFVYMALKQLLFEPRAGVAPGCDSHHRQPVSSDRQNSSARF